MIENNVSGLGSKVTEESLLNEEMALNSPDKEALTSAEEVPTLKEDAQFIQKDPATPNQLQVDTDTNNTATIDSVQSTKVSTPIEPVQYVDERTKVLGRKAELEALRNRNDLKEKKAAFNSESPMSTSLASFFHQQRQMKQEVRKNRQGALSSLSKYQMKDGEGMLATKNVKRNNTAMRHGAGMPSAYSTMADIDGFFRKQKQMDVEWRKNKEDTLRKLHMFRRSSVQNVESGSEKEYPRDDADDEPDAAIIAESPENAGSDDEVLNSLLMVHAELVQFFTAFSTPDTPISSTASPPPKCENITDSSNNTTSILVDPETSGERVSDDQVTPDNRITTDDCCAPKILFSNSPSVQDAIGENDIQNDDGLILHEDGTPSLDEVTPEEDNAEEPEQANGEHEMEKSVEISRIPATDDTQDSPYEEQVSPAQEGSSKIEMSDRGDEEQKASLDTADDDPPKSNGVSNGTAAAEVPGERRQDDTKATETDMQNSESAQDVVVENARKEEISDINFKETPLSSQGTFFTDNTDNAGEEKKDDSFDVLDALLGDSFEVNEGPKPDELGTPNSSNTDKKSSPLDDGLPEIDCNSEVHHTHDISSIPATPEMRRVDSLVSSMGSSIDEDSVCSGRLSRQSSSSSLSSFWDMDTEIPVDDNVYSEALMCSEEQYLPNLHSTKGPCERCLSLASEKERAMFRSNGRHVRIMLVRGGCKRSCTAFPRTGDEPPVRLCRKCYFDTHRNPGPLLLSGAIFLSFRQLLKDHFPAVTSIN